MTRTIHGLSHKALKAFREKAAALPVYWIYVSRMNNEGIAWPSVRGIAKDTGWNKSTCLQARDYLVSIQALERVKSYERPEWRCLDAKEKTQKMNLDRSEYYRPTGYIVFKKEKYLMLYNGADEPSRLDGEKDDVLQNRTSGLTGHAAKPDVDSHRTELNSPLQLDSKEITEPVSNTEKDADVVSVIKAWLDGQSTQPVTNQYGNKGVRSNAKALVGKFTPDQITSYVKELAKQPYWSGKLITIGYVANNIAAYYADKKPAVVNPSHIPFITSEEVLDIVPMPAEAIEARKQLASLMSDKEGTKYAKPA